MSSEEQVMSKDKSNVFRFTRDLPKLGNISGISPVFAGPFSVT